MKKLFRWLLLMITIMLLYTIPVFAMDSSPSKSNTGGVSTSAPPPVTNTGGSIDSNIDNGGYTGGNTIGDNQGYIDLVNENNNTGYLIYTSGADGKATSPVTFVSTTGRMPYSSFGTPINYGGLHTRFGDSVSSIKGGAIVWNLPPYTGNIGNGKVVEIWLKSPYEEVDKGADWVMHYYLDFSEDQIAEWYSGDNYLNIEPVLWGGYYVGLQHQGEVFVGTAYSWGLKGAGMKSMLGSHSNGRLPNSFTFDNAWLGLQIPSDINGLHSPQEMASPIGLGIGSVRAVDLKGGTDVIKTYYTSGVLDKTSYGKGESPIPVKDEGTYKVKEWFTSKTRTKLSGKQEYPTFESELAPKVQSGTGQSTVTMPEIEKTIVIKLERDNPPPPVASSDDVIYSHELNIVSPFLADYHRLDNPASTNNLVKFKLTKNEAETIVKNRYSGSGTISNIKIKNDSFVLKQEVSGVSGKNVRRNLYNSGAGTFATYSEISSGHEFALEGEIVPNYAVVVSRADSTWSDTLKVSNYRDENTADKMLYATEVLGFGESNIGDITGFAGAVENMDILSPANQENSYSFTYDITADYTETTTYETDVVDANGNPVLDASGNVQKTTVTNTEDKTDITFDKNSTEISYTVNMGCYKYRVDATPTASIATKGSINKDVTGGNGGVVNHSPLPAQFLNSQSNTTLKFYPEVPYVYWSAGATEYSNPTQALRIYMMGERYREVVPPIVHGYYTTVEGGNIMKGYSDLASPQTGSTADAIYDLWAESEKISGVSAQGTTFSVGTTKEVKIHFGSIILDCDPENRHNGVRSAWGNDNFEPKTHHTAYVGGIAPRITTDIYMKPVGGDRSAGGYEPFILGTSSSGVRKTNEQELTPVQIIWKEGKIQNEGEIIELFGKVFGANGADVYASWGLQEMLDTMYISSIDTDTDNASGVTESYPISNASDLRRGGSGNRWYDEESITMYLVGFQTEYSCGLLTANDKVEYGFLKQSYVDRYDADNVNKNNSLKMEFYSRVYLLNNDTHVTADGFSYDHSSTFRIDKIDGASFAVSQSTSSGMRK